MSLGCFGQVRPLSLLASNPIACRGACSRRATAGFGGGWTACRVGRVTPLFKRVLSNIAYTTNDAFEGDQGLLGETDLSNPNWPESQHVDQQRPNKTSQSIWLQTWPLGHLFMTLCIPLSAGAKQRRHSYSRVPQGFGLPSLETPGRLLKRPAPA